MGRHDCQAKACGIFETYLLYQKEVDSIVFLKLLNQPLFVLKTNVINLTVLSAFSHIPPRK